MEAVTCIPTLPSSVHRLVLCGGMNWYGAFCASCLATSPLLRRDQGVVVVEDAVLMAPSSIAGASSNRDVASTEVIGRQVVSDVISSVTETMVRGRDPQSATPPQYYFGGGFPSAKEVASLMGRISVGGGDGFVPDPARDIFMLVLNADVSEDADSAVGHLLMLLQMCVRRRDGDSGCAGRVIVLADNKCRIALQRSRDVISTTCGSTELTYVWVEEFSPPALDFTLTESFVEGSGHTDRSGLRGMLERVCAGVALGALRGLSVRRHDCAPFAPLDVAINVALLEVVRKSAFGGQGGSSAVTLFMAPTQMLVWGMVSEYLMDYYGRYATSIAEAFPEPGIFSGCPALLFPPNWSDTVNWGVDARDPLYCLERLVATRRRQRLILQSAKLAPLLGSLEGTMARAEAPRSIQQVQLKLNGTRSSKKQKKSPAHPHALSETVNGNALFALYMRPYSRLLQWLLTIGYEARPLCQFVSLQNVDWPMYIYCVARAVLEHVAALVDLKEVGKSCNARWRFPQPTRAFMNDIKFDSSRTPPFPSITRRLFPDANWLFRVSMGANGRRVAMLPGMTPQRLSAILSQPDVEQMINAVALQRRVQRDEVVAEARRILIRIGDNLNVIYARMMGLMVRKIFFYAFERINMNDRAYEKLRQIFSIPRVEVVLVPLHRSYSDFLVLTYTLAVMGCPCPHIVAGEDFLKMGKFAELMRGSGAFFMRRTFRGDPLYAMLFREYVRQLVRNHQLLEFFIEGTRSRSGKTMAPKLGILKFITDAYFEGHQNMLDDVLFVPVSLSYDELLEAKMYADELIGVPKPPESFSNMLKATSILKTKHGSINLVVGDPISLREFQRSPLQCPEPFKAKHTHNSIVIPVTAPATPAGIMTLPKSKSSTPASLLTALAWRITYELQRNVIITPPAAVAAVVECFGVHHSWGSGAAGNPRGGTTGLSVAQLHADVQWLREHLRCRDGNMSAELASWDAERIVDVSLGQLARFLCLRRSGEGTEEVVYEPATVTSDIGVNISTNQLIHVFMDEAVVATVAHAYGTEVLLPPSDPPLAPGTRTSLGSVTSFSVMRIVEKGRLSRTTQLLLQFLAQEFPNYRDESPWSFESWFAHSVVALQSGGQDERKVMEAYNLLLASSPPSQVASETTALPATQLFHFVCQLVFPHIEAIFLVTAATVSILGACVGLRGPAEAAIHQAAQAASRKLLGEGLLEYATSCNKEVLRHYVRSLVELSYVQVVSDDDGRPQGVMSYLRAVKVKEGSIAAEVAPTLTDLLALMNSLRWHPAKNLDEVAKTIGKAVLHEYTTSTTPSKV